MEVDIHKIASGNGMMVREIYEFHDGWKIRRVDPVLIDLKWRKELMNVDSESLLNRFNGPEWLREYDETGNVTAAGIADDAVRIAVSNRDEATLEILPLLYRTFDCTPYEFDGETGKESGTTANQILMIYVHFLEWQYGVKKNTEEMPPSDMPFPDRSRS